MAEVKTRLRDCRAVLVEESTQARQLLKNVLRGRLVFTPDFEEDACDFEGQGDPSVVFRGLVSALKVLASPTGTGSRYQEGSSLVTGVASPAGFGTCYPTDLEGIWVSDRRAA